MADLSKIKLNGTTYDFKDAIARPFVITLTQDENSNWYVADKTYAEINDAFENNRVLICYDSVHEKYYPFQGSNGIYYDRGNAFNFYEIYTESYADIIGAKGFFITPGNYVYSIDDSFTICGGVTIRKWTPQENI